MEGVLPKNERELTKNGRAYGKDSLRHEGPL